MKNKFKKAYIFAMLVAGVSITACSNDEKAEDKTEISEMETEKEEKLIVGTWKLTDIDFGFKASPEQQKEMDTFKNELIKVSQQTLNSDATYTEVSLVDDKKVENKGVYYATDTEISFTASGSKVKYKIEKLDETNLILSETDTDGIKMTMTYTRK